MNRFQSLRTALVLLVMSIMSISSFISGFFMFVFGTLGHLQLTPIFLTISMVCVSVTVGTLLAFFVTKRFLKPIRELIEANKRVASGDFSVRLAEENYSADGEMYELARSFNLMAAELGSVEMYRGDFINNFSHEFKTPIISIRGFARQLKNLELSQQQQNEYLDIIIKESEKLCNMSGNVLQMTKLENQSIVGDKDEFSLDEQIRSCILTLEPLWADKDINWELSLPDISFYGNADLLAQVWKNLLENAIKFVETGGTVGVRLLEERSHIEIRVFDNGCGMTEETAKHIFEKFYQGDTSHAKGGNGLGLAIVKRIVELCGGEIQVESALGKGTAFTVRLPR